MTAPDMFLCDEDNAVLEAIRKRGTLTEPGSRYTHRCPMAVRSIRTTKGHS